MATHTPSMSPGISAAAWENRINFTTLRWLESREVLQSIPRWRMMARRQARVWETFCWREMERCR